MHHKDIIEEVKLNIDGRALELTSPQIMLFNSSKLSKGDKGLLKRKILPTLSYFLKERGELVQKTLEGVIYGALKNHLFVDNDKSASSKVKDINGEDRTKYTISYKDICDKVKDLVDEENDPLHEQTFYSPDYGNVTHNEILEICRTKFLGIRGVIGSGNHKKRVLTFDRDDVERIGKSFDTITDIEIIEEEDQQQEQPDKEEEQDQVFWKDWEEGEKQ